MEASSTYPKTSFLRFFVSLLVLVCGIVSTVWGQGSGPKRTYANFQGSYEAGINLLGLLTGQVTDDANAVDGNVQTQSSLSVPVGVLGLLSATQFLEFTTNGNHANVRDIPANTPVTVKFSLPSEVLGLLSGVEIGSYRNLSSVNASLTNRAGYNTNNRTVAYSGTSLLNLLKGTGTFEVTFAPGQDYHGVFVRLSGNGLSVLLSSSVFHAYIYENGSYANCEDRHNPIDVLHGTRSEAIGALTSLGGVTNPYNAINGNPANFATMNVGVGALNTIYLNTVFPTPSEPGQVVRVVLEDPGSLLDLQVLSSFTIQPYNRGTAVGDPLVANAGLLSARLLPGTQKYELAFKVDDPFDRVELRFDNTVTALASLRVYEVSRLPRVSLIEDPSTLTAVLTGCGVVNLQAAITNYQPDFYDYHYYTASSGGTPLTSSNVTATGTYYIEAVDKVTGCISSRVPVTATVNAYPEIVFAPAQTTFVVAPGGSVSLPTPLVSNVSTSGIQWYDPNGNAFTPTGPIMMPATPGAYVYYVVATSTAGCQSAAAVVVIVNSDGCPPAFTREYAVSQTFSTTSLLGIQLGSVTDANNAVDGDPSTYATVVENLNLLGLTGETAQILSWGTDVNAGTPVTVKLARDYSVASVIGGIYVVPVNAAGNEIGPRVSVDPNLAAAVNGLNVFEHTFVPTGPTGAAVAYHGVKVVMASVVNALQTIRVYDAYYHNTGSADCSGGDVVDVFGGYEAPLLNLNLATGLIGAVNEGYAVDRDLATAAVLRNIAGVAARSKLEVVFATPSIVGDSLQILLGEPGSLLDVGLLDQLRIQRFFGNVPVEQPLTVNQSLLRLSLLGGSSYSVLTIPTTVAFDRVKITYGGVANVVTQLNIFEVSRKAATQLPGTPNGQLNTVEICQGETVDLSGLPDDCGTTYEIYDAPFGGAIADVTALGVGTHTLWIQPVRYGCASLARGVLTIMVTAPPTAPVIAPTGTQLVAEGTDVTLEIANAASYAAGTTFQWFKDGDPLSGQTGATLTISNFATANLGAYTAVATRICASPASAPTTLTMLDVDTWMSADQTSVIGGEEITYTIYIRNNSTTNDIAGVSVDGPVPTRTVFVSAEDGGTENDGTVSFDNVSVPAGQTVSVSYKVRVNNDLTGVTEISNVALVKTYPGDAGIGTVPPADPGAPGAGPDTGVAPGTPTVVLVDQVVDYTAWKSYSVGGNATLTAVSGGETVDYTIWIRNNGNQQLNGLIVTDALPPGVTYVPVSGNPAISETGGVVTITGITVPVGGVVSRTFSVTVNEDLTGINIITNTAYVKTDAGDPGDPTHPPVDNTDPEGSGPDESETGTSLDVTPVHDVDLALNGSSNGTVSGQAVESDIITYTISITNTGNKALTNVAITGLVPEHTTYVTGSGGSESAGVVAFTIPSLAADQTQTFTYRVEVGAIDASVTSIDNTATAIYRNAADDGNETGIANHSMPTNCTPIEAADIDLSDDEEICVGEPLTLTATIPGATVDPTFIKWYTNPGLTGTPFTGASVVVSPTATTTYYVIVEGTGFCFNNPPAEVTVTVNQLPATPTIAITGDATVCAGGSVTLTSSAATGNQWFLDGDEITGATGETYTALVSGTYTVVVTNASDCESLASAGAVVVVQDAVEVPTITPDGSLNVCQGSSVLLTASLADAYQWYLGGVPISGATNRTLDAAIAGEYTVMVTVGGCDSPVSAGATVTVSEQPVIELNGPLTYAIEVGQTVPVPVHTTEAGVTYQWFNQNGGVFIGAQFGPFGTAGVYTYTLVATQGGCSSSVSVVINVYNEGECPPVYDRVYNTAANGGTVAQLLGLVTLGNVANPQNAASADVTTYSTLSEVASINLLGLTGETSQTLTWGVNIAAGTPVTVKLAKDYGVGGVIGGIYVQAVDASGNDVGSRQWVDPNLASVVNGLNVFEYTFAPTAQFRGIRIAMSAVVNLVQTVRVYNAYYHRAGTPDCDNPNGVRDVLDGMEFPLGIANLVTGLTGVANPRQAVDGDDATYATLRNTVGANGLTKLEVAYGVPALAGDTVSIHFSKPASVLTAGLLESFVIQPYLGNTAVGNPINSESSLLRIELLPGASEGRVIYTADVPFDRIKILYGGIASVVDELRIHEVTRKIPAVVAGPDGDNRFDICAGEDITIDPDDCTTYIIYTTENGNTVANIPTLTAGTHTLYVQTVRFGSCGIGERTPITVIVKANGTVADIIANDIDICFGEDAALSATSTTVTDAPVFTWYTDAGLTDMAFTTATGQVHDIAGLAVGNHTYYVTIQSETFCENLPGAAAIVTVTVRHQVASDDIDVPEIVGQCAGEDVEILAAIATGVNVINPVFTWYFDAAGAQPISSGTVGGVTYTVNGGTLTINGLPDGANPTYYVSLSGDNVCANGAGDLASVSVSVGDALPAPVVPSVAVCEGENAVLTVSSPQSNLDYRWYTTVDGTVPFHTGTSHTLTGAMANVTYYIEAASSGGGSCVSDTRTAVTITVSPRATDTDIDVTGATICAGESVDLLGLVASAVPGATFRFYTDQTLATAVTGLTVSPGSSTTYYVTVSGTGICENAPGDAAELTVTVDAAPELPQVTPAVSVSRGQGVILTAALGGAQSGNPDYELVWVDGTTETVGTTFTVPGTLPVGQKTYEVYVRSRIGAGCESPRVTVTVTVTPVIDGDCLEANSQRNGTTGICLLCGVTNAGSAVNGNTTSYAVFQRTVGVAGGVWQELIFPTAGRAGDTVSVILGGNGSLLNVSLLGGLRIQTYGSGTANNDGITGGTGLINIQLLPGSSDANVLRFIAGADYDRVRISQTDLVGALANDLRVYGARMAMGPLEAIIPADGTEYCPGDGIELSATPSAGTSVRWYDRNGTLIDGGSTVTVTAPAGVTGPIVYYAELFRGDCADPNRIPVTVTIKPTASASDIDITNIALCLGESVDLSSLVVSTVPGAMFRFYTDGALTNEITDLTVSPAATAIYYVTVSGTAICENAPSDAGVLTVTITATPAPTLDELDQEFCEIDGATVADLNTAGGTGVIWYTSATGGTALAPTAVLTGGTYYAAQVLGGCESLTRTAVSVTITATPAPTLDELDQEFCEIDGATVADLNTAGGTGVIWYTSATGGTALAPTAVLTGGTYYAAQVVDGCESLTRTAVSVTITATPAPTLDELDQEFCEIDGATVADLNTAGGTGVIWYSAATGGTALVPTAVLTGGTYYAAQVVDGCESLTRTAVSVTITATPAPTLDELDQTFCEIDGATVAELNTAGGTGVIWYNAATGGTALAPTAVLTGGTYYAAQVVDGCESLTRTAVSVTIMATPAPTLEELDQEFCEIDGATVADLNTAGGTGVIWYTSATGGTALLPTTALASGTYYAAQVVDGCESLTRTAVSVTIMATPAPTLDELDQEFCEIDGATVSDLNTAGGTGVIWYTSATGGTALAPTAVLTGGTYYAAQVVDGCESLTRTAVSVTITATPAPMLDELDQEFCEIDGATVSDLNTAGGTGVIWYTSATGGTALAPTAVLTGGSYYAAQVLGGCESATRTAVTVTITATPAPTLDELDQEFCEIDGATVSDLNTAGGTGVIWYSAATGGTALAPTAVLTGGTYYAAQVVDGCESLTRTAVSVTITATPAPTLDELDQEFCEIDGATVADLNTAGGTGVIWYTSATGGTALAPTAVLTGGTYYAAQVVDGCESLTRTAVSVTITATPAPTLDELDQEFCEIDGATVSDLNTAGGTGVIWYTSATGGTTLAPTAVLTGGTYYAAQVVDGCESLTRTAVSVTITATPAPTLDELDQEFCEIDGATVSDLNTAGGTGVIWYTSATGGTALAPTAVLTGGTYYAAQVLGGCESLTRTAVSVTITATPAPTLDELDQEFCEIDGATVSDLNTAGGTGVIWYTSATGGTALAPTAVLTGGTYYAAQVVDGCESLTRTAVSVTITATPAPTLDELDQEFCEIDGATVSDLNTAGGTGVIWYTSATGGTALAPTAVLTGGTYYAAQVVDGCESLTRTAVSVTITATPAPTLDELDQEFCEIDGATVSDLNTAGGTGVIWYSAATGGTALLPTTALASGTYYAVQVLGGCESLTRTAVSVTITATPAPTLDELDQEFCEIDGATVADLNTAGGTGVIWYSAATGGTALAPTAVLTGGSYYAAQVLGGCESLTRTAVSVTITATPAPTLDELDQEFCEIDGATVSDLNTAGGTGVIWYSAATGGTALLPTTALASGTYYAAQVVDGCESLTRTAVSVTITATPAPTLDELDQEFCEIDGATVSDLNTAGGTGVIWYSAATGGTALAPTAVLTGGTYYAVQVLGGCESLTRTAVSVTITATPAPTLDELDQEFCEIDGATVSDLNTAGGTGVIWYNAATGGTALAPTAVLTGGTYYAAQVLGGCESLTRTAISVTITATPAPTLDELDQEFCEIDGATVSDLNTAGGTGVIWYSAATGGTALAPPTPLASGIYYAAQEVDDCESATRTAVTVTITATPAPGLEEVEQTFCEIDGATVSDLNTAGGTGVIWYSAATGGTALAPTAVLTGGIYYATQVVGGCESATRTAVTVTIEGCGSELSITKVANQSRVVAGQSTTFTATITNNGPVAIESGATIALRERPSTGVVITRYEVISGSATITGSANEATLTTTGVIAAGGTIVVGITATVDADAPSTITNGISVWGPDKNPEAENPDDEDETPEIPVDRVSNMGITKVADQSRVRAGTNTTFTVTVTNNGPSVALSGNTIALRETPSAGLTITGYEVFSGPATIAGNGNVATLTTTDKLILGGTIVFRVTAAVAADAPVTISNGISVWGPDKDPETEDPDDEDETPEIPVDPNRTLSITKVADQAVVTAGQPTTFTVTVTNNGPSRIEVGEIIPLQERPGVGVSITGYEIISGAASVTGTGNSAMITTTGVFGVAADIVVRVTAMVAETASGTITNGIAVWGPDKDPDDDDPDDEDNTGPIPVDVSLVIPNVFTPNGDGLNDQFVIRNLLQYQGRELLVLNRWGNQVYKSDNYNNDWDGGTLAEGTYYYILRVRSGSNGEWQTYKGAVAIIRVTGR